MRYLQAQYLFTACPNTSPIPNGILQINAQTGAILGVFSELDTNIISNCNIEKYDGILCPGFVNTHCHIELSHLKKAIPKHTGLLGFLPQIAPLRQQFSSMQIQQAIEKAHQEMYNNGIVAVGDIANDINSLQIKGIKKNAIHYHTFIEVFDVQPNRTAAAWANALQHYEQFKNLAQNPNCTIVPHAPYTVTPFLFQKITQFYDSLHTNTNLPISIHNQECKDEDLLFSHAQGGFYDLHQRLQNNTSFYTQPPHKSAIHYTLHNLNANCNTPLIMVHNTYTTPAHTQYATHTHPYIYWCLCPNANLYIENNLPNIAHLAANYSPNITLGTDSLASNDQLCILSEIKTIHKHCPDIPLPQLFSWGTFNGAKALNMHTQLGSFEVGKQPGVNLIEQVDVQRNKILEMATVKKIV